MQCIKENPKTNTPYTYLLRNGMVVNFVNTTCNEIFKIEMVIRAGSLDEKPEQIGFAHFIEHLMSFYPSKLPDSLSKRLGGDFPNSVENQNELDEMGVLANAWTSERTCGYFIQGLSEYSEKLIDLMFKNYIHPYLDREIFEQERNAVISELTAITNQSWYNIDQVIDFVNYRDTNIAYTVEYEKQNVKNNATVDNIMEFRNKWYTPENTSITILSNLKESQMENLVENIASRYFPECETMKEQTYPNRYSRFNTVQKFGSSYVLLLKKPPIYQKKEEEHTEEHTEEHIGEPIPENLDNYRIFYTHPDSETDTVKIEFHFPLSFTLFDDRQYTLNLVKTMLTRGLGSRLYGVLRIKLGAVYHVNSEYNLDPLDEKFSNFVIETETTLDKAKDVTDEILNELDKIHKGKCKITEKEMKQYKNSIKMISGFDHCTLTFTKFIEVYENSLLWGHKCNSIKNIRKIQESQTKEDLMKLARDVFNPEKLKIFYSAVEEVLKTENNEDIHLNIKLSDLNVEK